MMWKTINTNSNLMKCKKNGNYKIKIPKTDYLFWHPEKLVSFSGKNNHLMTILYSNDSWFYTFRHGKGVHNDNQVIDERYLNISEFEEHFNQHKVA